MEKMFETAIRSKVRFETTKGQLSTEDLWDIPMTSKLGFSLDDIAKGLYKRIKETEETSFVVKKSPKNKLLELKFEIVKYIIKTRLEEKEIAKNALAKAQQKEKILGLIADKEDEELKSKTKEDLLKMLED